MRQMLGDVSGLFKSLVTSFFDPHAHDFSSAGISLKLPDGSVVRCFLQLRIVIADEAAIHALYACKGSSGLKPCLLCQNIFNRNEARGIVEADRSGFSQHHTCHETSKLVLQTPESVRAIIARLNGAHGTMSKVAFNELQTRLGWNYSPGGAMFDPVVSRLVMPSQVVLYDYMHVFFVGGVFNVHVGKLMRALKPHGITHRMLNAYVVEWRWPLVFETKFTAASGPFTDKRAASSWEAGSLKATASECLALAPVLAQFFERLATNSSSRTVRQHATSFVKLVSIIDTIRRSSRCDVDAIGLRAVCESYLADFKELYGTNAFTTKFHAVLHFPLSLQRWAYLPNCWVLERKHKQPKRVANELRNTTGTWESTVARDVTARHVDDLQSRTASAVVGRSFPMEPLAKPRQTVAAILMAELPGTTPDDIRTCKGARVNYWEKVFVGDAVLLNPVKIGQVGFIAFLSDGGVSCLVVHVHVWEFMEHVGPRACKLRRTGRYELVDADDILCALAWAGAGDIITVLRPTHLDAPWPAP